MTEQEIEQVFHRKFNGHPNVFTPVIVGFGQVGKFIYEMSRQREEARDIMKFDLAMTVLEKTEKGFEHRHDLSQCHLKSKTEIENILQKTIEEEEP